MTAAPDIYAYWRAALAGKPDAELVELRLPTLDGMANGEAPQCGLWRVAPAKGQPMTLLQVWLVDEKDGQPALEWRDGLSLRGRLGMSHITDAYELSERWLFAQPVSKDDARHWHEHGRWPGDAPPLAHRSNMPDDPFEALKAEVDDRLEQIREWITVNAPITDQTTCDIATNMHRELLDLRKRSDAMHEIEKRPHLEAGRAVDNKFRFRETMREWADKLRLQFETFLRAEERRRQEEARRKYEEERAAAEAERQRLMEQHPDIEPPPPAPPPPEPVKVTAGGGVGKRASLRTALDVAIVDYQLATAAVLDDPDVQAIVLKVVTRRAKAAKGKIEIPGVQITEVRKAA